MMSERNSGLARCQSESVLEQSAQALTPVQKGLQGLHDIVQPKQQYVNERTVQLHQNEWLAELQKQQQPKTKERRHHWC
jgi:hypothetical protein